ncbi:membrane hypothetical protein [Cupriavidus taiwanensis]|uniref:Major facilitator superfamily (MFS) profile domain-containing protein n=1 Tax=Cupriavidus taiwanensis TaxID=164546 RepID=A0A976AY76_9BURK|nr:membrane hypothetical protein [Cupriavidus taiwanensis]SOZ60069.1 membrane hypothetical protein [Cupriavidus taiwanensis]SOZ63749.1 membrane hypothetical protein [Cupriavidus taiwanensis]SPA06525.1 membrane hypothetical protein [Cupriavidus taiwanensis]
MSTEDAVITAGMPAADGAQRTTLRRTIITSIVGQALEWYDFFLYGTAAALIFGKLFFPIGTDPLVGTLAAFGGFAVGFVARPLGGVVCGHLGDRYGRKLVLVLTLVVMGVATTAMGLLPTYQQIGIWAPVLLVSLRFLQGLAAGGEWSGSILIISENAPPARLPVGVEPQRRDHRLRAVGGGVLGGAEAACRRLHGVGLARAVPGQHGAGGGGLLHPQPDPGERRVRCRQAQRPWRAHAGGRGAAQASPSRS